MTRFLDTPGEAQPSDGGMWSHCPCQAGVNGALQLGQGQDRAEVWSGVGCVHAPLATCGIRHLLSDTFAV